MTPTLRLGISVEDYLTMSLPQECELIAGELRPKPMGTSEHSDIQTELLFQLRTIFGRARTRVELSIRHGEDVLIPDVCVLPAGTLRWYRGILDEAPLLCVEVVSPSQRPGEIFSKCETYHAWGVPFCWVVDPVAKRAWNFHKGQHAASEVFDSLSGPTGISLNTLF